ncbi:MAG: Jag N-terminal domain-containing protein [Acidimicrobiia bacterium]|nr:Jag N-terminal domain-containing protein [Acidimicrobiia bacterium]
MEWVEVEGNSIDEAVEMAMRELGIKHRDDADVEVIQEPKAGFLGMGGKAAIVKVTKSQDRRPGRRGRGRDSNGRSSRSPAESTKSTTDRSQQGQPKTSNQGDHRSRSGSGSKDTDKASQKKSSQKPSNQRPKGEKKKVQRDDRPEAAPIEEQAKVAAGFLTGLLEAFGLEGSVESRIDDEVLYLEVNGEQTEALVGAKGSVMYSVLELTRTVVQRKTYGAPRMRIDINGYAERRREALKIYAGKLAEQVIADEGEVMLEPMNAADRKVVHDAIAEIDNVRSYSEGEDPRRAVVIAFDDDPS